MRNIKTKVRNAAVRHQGEILRLAYYSGGFVAGVIATKLYDK